MDKEDVMEQLRRYATFDTESYSNQHFNQWNNDVALDFRYEDMLLTVMLHLEKTGGVEFAILKDPELGRWWAKKSKQIAIERKRNNAIDKLKATMTTEELKLLGISI